MSGGILTTMGLYPPKTLQYSSSAQAAKNFDFYFYETPEWFNKLNLTSILSLDIHESN